MMERLQKLKLLDEASEAIKAAIGMKGYLTTKEVEEILKMEYSLNDGDIEKVKKILEGKGVKRRKKFFIFGEEIWVL